MASEIGKKDRAASQRDSGVKRRGLLRIGTLITAFTGASAVSAIEATRAQAEPIDATILNAYVPTAEKGVALGVATLDPLAKVPSSQLPDLAATTEHAIAAYASDKTSTYARYVRLTYGDPYATNTQKIQSAMDSLKSTGGTIYLDPNGRPAYDPTAGIEVDKLTQWARVRVVSLSCNGVRLKARPGIRGAIWTCGATDGTDMNWHFGMLDGIQFDGNKANQTAAPKVAISRLETGSVSGIPTVTSATTVTTTVAHGYALGDVVEIAGTSHSIAHGKWVILAVPTPTTFVIVQVGIRGGTGGTATLMLNCVNVLRGGETSELTRVHVSNAMNSGIFYGLKGTPFRMTGCAAFTNNDYGFDLWVDRPLYLEGPSGDGNGRGLITIEGPPGSAFGQASVTVTSIKSEFQTTPVVTLRNWLGSAEFIGGSAEMATGNTSPAFRRIGTGESNIEFRGLRIDMRQAGTVFDDQSNAGQTRTTTYTGAFTYNDHIGAAATARSERFSYLGGATPTPYVDKATNFWLRVDSAATTINVQSPVSFAPQFSPDVQTLTFVVQNNTKGAIKVNFPVAFKTGGWTPPAAGKYKTIVFKKFTSSWFLVTVSPEY